MAGEFATLRAQARRVIHDTMAVPMTHVSSTTGVSTGLAVRWHRKMDTIGDLVAQGYAQAIEARHTVIFDRTELDEKSVVLRREDTLTDDDGVVLILDALEPAQGPQKVTWRVVQREG